MKAQEVGPHHQHRVGARARREPVQVGLRRRQARHRRPDEDRRARGRDARHHDERDLSRLRLDAARRKADSRHGEGARPHRGAGDQRRAAARAADEGVRPGRAKSRRSPRSSRADDAASITGAIIPIDGGWTASSIGRPWQTDSDDARPRTNEAPTQRARRTTAAAHARRRVPGQVVLVLQGGGALGAYQVGVYEALHEAGIEPDWVIGTSIGAINAALIAGNAPANRLDAADASSGLGSSRGVGARLRCDSDRARRTRRRTWRR